MIKLDGMLMIGSAGANVGKTELACALIKKFGKTTDIIGIKVTTIGTKDGQCPRGGHLRKALAGVDAAKKAELTPIKINMVILDDTTEEDIETMKAFCEQRGLQLQKIMQFSLYDRADLSSRFKTQRPPKCSQCNRLRLTADGFLKPCLFSDNEVRVNFGDIAGSILEAVAKKPENGSNCKNRLMSQIGG